MLNNVDPSLVWTKFVVFLSIGIFLLTIVVAFLTVLFLRSRQQRSLKTQNEPSESTPFSTKKTEITRPKDIKLIPIAPGLAHLNEVDVNENAYLPPLSTNGTKKNRKSNLFQRRVNKGPLTISVNPKSRHFSNSPTERSPEEYLQIATRKLTIAELHQRAQETYSLYQEFWATPTNHVEKLRITGVATKNRYLSILANEHSRVKLSELPDGPISTYINANYISGWPNDARMFIATQGPLAGTIVDFYRMVWQEYVPVIVMITRLVEQNKSKCERYIPELKNHQYGPFYVEVNSISNQNDYEIRRLTIEFENEKRQVDHYWYTAWPDHSCPSVVQPLIDLAQDVEKSRVELSKTNTLSGPVVVHCSAGIGRTGCFIAISNGIKQLNKEHAVDILRILCNLRQDRGGMIEKNDQYQFVYQALSQYASTIED